MERNGFGVQKYCRYFKCGWWWVKEKENLIGVIKSRIGSQKVFAVSSWRHVADHCFGAKLWPSLKLYKKKKKKEKKKKRLIKKCIILFWCKNFRLTFQNQFWKKSWKLTKTLYSFGMWIFYSTTVKLIC